MSSFICDKCGAEIIDSDNGYLTGCEHYPVEIHPPSDRYPKEVKYIRHNDLNEYIADGWRLVGVQPLMTSVNNLVVERGFKP